MKFNLVSNLGENYNPDLILQYNTAIAWSLRRALEEAGHEVFFVRDHADGAPSADHSLVISNWAMNRVRGDPSYLVMLREATGGKLGLWLDAAFSGMEELYDIGYEVPRDLEAWKKAIQKLTPAKVATKGKEARKWIEENWPSWDDFSVRMTEIFEETSRVFSI